MDKSKQKAVIALKEKFREMLNEQVAIHNPYEPVKKILEDNRVDEAISEKILGLIYDYQVLGIEEPFLAVMARLGVKMMFAFDEAVREQLNTCIEDSMNHLWIDEDDLWTDSEIT